MRISKYIEIELPNEDEYEKCVVCNKITDVKKETDIDFRNNYIIGVGQLCDKCYKELYEPNCRGQKDVKK